MKSHEPWALYWLTDLSKLSLILCASSLLFLPWWRWLMVGHGFRPPVEIPADPQYTHHVCAKTIYHSFCFRSSTHGGCHCSATREWGLAWISSMRLSMSICAEQNSSGKCSQIPQRKVRWKMDTTYFGWDSRFRIQKWCVTYSKIPGYGNAPPRMIVRKRHDCSESNLMMLHSSFSLHHLSFYVLIPIILVSGTFRFLARVSMTKYYGLGNVSNSHFFSHSSGGWTSKIKVTTTGMASRVSSLPWLWMAALRLCPHMAFPLSLHVSPGLICYCPTLRILRSNSSFCLPIQGFTVYTSSVWINNFWGHQPHPVSFVYVCIFLGPHLWHMGVPSLCRGQSDPVYVGVSRSFSGWSM